ncbi:DUF4062 domain-containing protein [Leptospira levettii]|uniref:DUF4062 domain-containing protein n=1 Tax=Leptospira levettii TaxID=2023178 RepID=UPI00223D6D15|nr:DUF4062 domain-containing protein [Leptospira levettii]MCW7498537.1 DUF4062 domain-containing protein [Leptospira levettii]
MEKKYQIFISSTYTDLVDERMEVINTILSMYQIPIGMEYFNAADSDQWEIIKNTIDFSDYYLLILGQRYGSVDSNGFGFTEKEYDYALSQGIPIYSFVLDETVPRKNDQRESEADGILKIKNFREKVLKNSKMADFWKEKNELAKKVSLSLTKAFKDKPRIGWIRSNNAASIQVLEEISKLSTENRQLRDQLEFYTKGSDRRPILNLSLDQKEIQITPFKSDYPDYIKKIGLEDIPEEFREFVTEEEIREYNNEIEEKTNEVKEYNVTSFQNFQNTYNRKPISLKIKNTGTLKATSITITMKFPDDIDVSKEEKFEEIKNRNPLKILHPENIARKRSYEMKKDSQKMLDFIHFGGTGINRSFDLTNRIALLSNNNNNIRIDKSKHIVTINIESLLHKLEMNLTNKIYLIPYKKGKFVIKYSIICEEISDLTDGEIEIEIL